MVGGRTTRPVDAGHGQGLSVAEAGRWSEHARSAHPDASCTPAARRPRPVERWAAVRDMARLRLETERLELRPLALDDLDGLASMLGDAEALTFWGGPLDREGARRWIERNLARYKADGFGRCAVIMRETGELVGDCGLITTLVEGRPEVELGWIVRRAHWGRGIATEAGAAWRDFAFDAIGQDRIVSMISADIVASRRVAEKLGMSVEREARWGDLPHLMYSLRARDRVRRPEM